MMLNDIPFEILELIINSLNCNDTYHILLTNNYLNDSFGKEKFKKKFNYFIVNKLVNLNFFKFKNQFKDLNDNDRDKIFINCIHNIKTIWLNQEQGFYDMKYILECIINGSRIYNKNKLINHTSKHFYKHFYFPIIECIEDIYPTDRNKIQENIDQHTILKSLHSDFIPVQKIM